MTYTLGLDLGTTSSAAAINDGSTVRMLSVDHSAAVIPSVVHLDADGDILVGTAAERRAISDPGGVAREFKRRFGDPQPLILSGTPVAANDLMVEVAAALVEIATKQLGEAPERLVVCHPANWGSYKLGLLADTLNNSALPPHTLISEPEAAAIHYASQERVGDGEVIAVYDLGGGTFDAVVLRKNEGNASGWEILGEPRGIERLGGIDFDLAVLTHVIGVLDLDLDAFDSDDASNQAAMTRFRDECREAKHALSSDVSATVPVLLPGFNETVRITRREFEQLIDPALGRTIDTLEVAVSTTGLEMAAIDRILLVGGSTRVPLVAARLSAVTNRPIKSDAHPKHAMALGAAALASTAATETEVIAPPITPPAGTPKAAAPSHTELYSLPHIDEQPLPEFMKGRPAPSRGSDAPPPAPTPSPSAPQAPAAPAAPVAAPKPLDPPTPAAPPPAAPTPTPTTPVAPPASAPTGPIPTTTPAHLNTQSLTSVGPVLVEERVERNGRSPLLIFALSFIIVGALVGAILFAIDRSDSTDASSPTSVAPATTAANGDAGSDSTAASGDSTVPEAFETSCVAGQLPDPAVRYRVTVIPDTFDEPTLNGRNVPSTSEVDGVTSFPITAFPELSELDISNTSCEVADNGRVWWGVNYSGPDNSGADFTGIVWASTRFIEPVPDQ